MRHHRLGDLGGVLGGHGDHVDDAVPEAGLDEDLAQQHVRGRGELRALEDDGVAGGEREGDGAGRQDHRRVPGRDADDDARRLADAHAQAAGDVRRDDLPAHVGGEAGRLAQHARREVDVEVTPAGGGAALCGHALDEAVGVGLQQVGGLQQQRPASRRRRGGPRRERRGGGVDGLQRVLDTGRLAPGHHFPADGVGPVERPAAAGGQGLVADEQVGLEHGRDSSC
ncbi:hypothetical protein U6N30_08410 [Blastococcus brunescens]|uniref:Uncharacterized protein n=1 Tax=Blastococcus brunescens TaxID=1564165 RepID=A0ABZ1B473_9ACTN|nr:hypothetical protein [Blastococcus sp. BMG 8361]WRL65591.1 hypothetical protein U6N30_08410 [Blastococcus sp. BMG 8361]